MYNSETEKKKREVICKGDALAKLYLVPSIKEKLYQQEQNVSQSVNVTVEIPLFSFSQTFSPLNIPLSLNKNKLLKSAFVIKSLRLYSYCI